jgi:hypothetical protein
MIRLRRSRVAALQHDTTVLAWLHAELVYELKMALTARILDDQMLAWLHNELVHELQTALMVGLANGSKPRDPAIVARAQKIAAARAAQQQVAQ